MKTWKKLFFNAALSVLALCFIRDHLSQSSLSKRANATLIDPGPVCFKHKSDTNHRANVARIQRGVQNWLRRVDPHNYTYIINPTERCEPKPTEGKDLLIVIFVNSAPDHFLRRNLIRNTFARAETWPPLTKDARHNNTNARHPENASTSMRVVFSLGAVDDAFMQTRLRDEATIFGDIVQENFTDDYLNMTLKSVMGLKWTTTYCSRARFVMKLDDDVLINPKTITTLLIKGPSKFFARGDLHNHAIVRDPKSAWGKFYTPPHLWPKKRFPPFFTGPAYIFSMDVAKKVYAASLETPLFPWSDVYVGMCCSKAGILLRNQKGFILSDLTKRKNESLPTDKKHIDFYNKIYTVFHVPVSQMAQLWKMWTNRTISLQ